MDTTDSAPITGVLAASTRQFLRLAVRDDVAWITIDRPAARNALTPEMYAGIGDVLVAVDRAPELRATVITGTGDVFVPGGDLGGDDVPRPISQTLPWERMIRAEKPIVAAINGMCFASGLMFAMLADVAVAVPAATFRAPELIRGFPDVWLAAVLPAHVGVGRAAEIAQTNRLLGADEAQRIGLIQRIAEPDRLEQAATDAVHELVCAAPTARRLFKAALARHYGHVDDALMDWAPSSPEVAEGFAAFRERRRPAWHGLTHS